MANNSLTPEQAIYVTIASILMIKSVVSNFCIIVVIYMNKGMRTTTNIFIANLAVSDILMGGIILPQMVHDISHTGEYDEGYFACRFVTALPILCITASIYSLVVMAVERYRAICTTKGSMSRSIAKKLSALTWFLSIFVSIPTFIEYSVKDIYNEVTLVDYGNGTAPPFDPAHKNVSKSCGNVVGWTYGLTNGVFLLLVAYVIPLIVISVSYVKVAIYISDQAKKQEASASEGSGKSNFVLLKNKVRVIKMLVVVAALFAFSWMPYFVLLLIAKITGIDGTEEASGPLNLIKLSLSIFSVNYNVYLYLYFTASFRAAFKQLFCPCVGQRVGIEADGATVHNNSTATAATNPDE